MRISAFVARNTSNGLEFFREASAPPISPGRLKRKKARYRTGLFIAMAAFKAADQAF